MRLPVPETSFCDGPVLDDSGWLETKFSGREKWRIPIVDRSEQNAINPEAFDEHQNTPCLAWPLTHQATIFLDDANSILLISCGHG